MNIRQSVTPVVVSLLVVAMAGPTSAGAPASGATVRNIALIPVSGIVSVQPESVEFSGQARVLSELVLDTSRFHQRPRVILTIDLSKVSGTGSWTGAKYVAGSHVTSVSKQLVGADTLEITFPFFRSAARESSPAQSGVASFALSFDLDTGAITNGTVTVAAPNFPEPETRTEE